MFPNAFSDLVKRFPPKYLVSHHLYRVNYRRMRGFPVIAVNKEPPTTLNHPHMFLFHVIQLIIKDRIVNTANYDGLLQFLKNHVIQSKVK